jgi:Ohr subfamily peroxiredoxin
LTASVGIGRMRASHPNPSHAIQAQTPGPDDLRAKPHHEGSPPMSKLDNTLFSGKTRTTTRGAHKVDMQLASGDKPGLKLDGVESHPIAEQLFAGAWSACYTGALRFLAPQMNVTLPPDVTVDIAVDLGQVGGAFALRGRIDVTIPGVSRELAEALAHKADEICPYSVMMNKAFQVSVNVLDA